MTPERREEIREVVERWRVVGAREGRSLMLVELWDELMAEEEARDNAHSA